MKERQAVLTHCGVRCIYKNLIEEEVDVRTKACDGFQLLAVAGYQPEAHASRLEGTEETPLGAWLQKALVDSARCEGSFGLFEDVSDSFEGGGYGFEVGGGADFADGFESVIDID